MNEKLLAWLDRVERTGGIFRYENEESISNAEALAQLRAMLKEPTDEERTKMLKDFEYILGVSDLPESDWTPKIRAVIMARPSVTMTQIELLVETGKQEGMSPEYLAGWLRSLGLEVTE